MAEVTGTVTVVGSQRTLTIDIEKYLRWKDQIQHYADGGHLTIVPLKTNGMFHYIATTRTKQGSVPYWCMDGWDYQIDSTVESRLEDASSEFTCCVDSEDSMGVQLQPRRSQLEEDTVEIRIYTSSSYGSVVLTVEDAERLRDLLVNNIKPE